MMMFILHPQFLLTPTVSYEEKEEEREKHNPFPAGVSNVSLKKKGEIISVKFQKP
jgi:hypothetical protein